MGDIREKMVPPQSEGGKKDIAHTVHTVDDEDARKLFMIARNRLMDVNHWDKLAGAASAGFTLTDSAGSPVDRTAEKNDYLRINLPAPGPAEGHGYDWVNVEAIEDKSDSAGLQESFAMRVRPAPDPTQKGENVAHFFNDHATSTFIIERNGRDVTAQVLGRNEVLNTETGNIVDKVRNALVGATAIAGLSNVQWKNLLKGLIEPK